MCIRIGLILWPNNINIINCIDLHNSERVHSSIPRDLVTTKHRFVPGYGNLGIQITRQLHSKYGDLRDKPLSWHRCNQLLRFVCLWLLYLLSINLRVLFCFGLRNLFNEQIFKWRFFLSTISPRSLIASVNTELISAGTSQSCPFLVN